MNLKTLRLMLSMIPSVWRGVRPGDLETIKAIARSKFPSVPHISGEELQRLNSESVHPPLLIDVRSPSEYAISHLPGALNLRAPEEIITQAQRDPRRPVVVYCAVGYRSGGMATRLLKLGLREVMNLEGSIFEWANQERPLVRDSTPVRHVHPCNPRWSALLNPGLAASKPFKEKAGPPRGDPA